MANDGSEKKGRRKKPRNPYGRKGKDLRIRATPLINA